MSSILKVNTIQDGGGNAIITSDGSGTFTPGSLNIANAQIASNAAIATTKLGTGAVMQVVSTTKTDTFATNPSSSFIDVTGLSVSITPSSTSSKVLINISENVGRYIAEPIAILEDDVPRQKEMIKSQNLRKGKKIIFESSLHLFELGELKIIKN